MASRLGDRLPLFPSTIKLEKPRAPSAPSEAPASERYLREGELGTGGMGRVERGTDRLLNRAVAIKHSLEPHMRQVLLREAEIAARLEHPSIVTIHDVAQGDGDEPFVVMRLVDGERLSEVVARTTDLGARLQLLPRLAAAIEAVAHAHRRGVVHRDLKPDNILLGAAGETVVIDWGLALDLADGSDPFAGTSLGTVGFMAPEQVRKEPVDRRGDVFALGMTLYFVLANRVPGEGVDAGAAIVVEEPGVPRDLVAVVHKATARDPAQRYADAGELAAELQRFIGGQLVAAHHYTLGQRFARWLRRYRVAVAIGGLALAASAIGGVIAIYNVFASRELAERERRAAIARGDQLIEDRALALVGEDPPRALALLDLRTRNVPSPRAWATAVEATAAGVPVMWKPHDGPVVDILMPGGGRVVTAGRDGRVVLRRRDGSVHELSRHPGSLSAAQVDDGFIVAGPDRQEWFDRDGHRRSTWPARGVIDLMGGGHRIAWRVGPQLFVRDLATAATQTFDVGVSSDLALDRTGTWCAIATGERVRVLELATGAVRVDAPVRALTIVWSGRGDHVLASGRGVMTEWSVADWTAPPRTWPTTPSFGAYLGTNALAIGLTGCLTVVADDPRPPLTCFSNTTRGLAWDASRLAVIDPEGRSVRLFEVSDPALLDTRLVGAPKASQRVQLGPDGDVAVAAADGTVAYWNLRARAIQIVPLEAGFARVLGDQVIVERAQQFVALDRGQLHPLARIPIEMLHEFELVAAGRDHVVARSARDNTLHRLTRERDELLLRDVTGALKLGDGAILYSRGRGAVARLELATHRTTPLVERPVELVAIDSDGSAVAAVWTDGHGWWQTAPNVTGEGSAGCAPERLQIVADRVEVACARRLVALSPHGEPRTIATIPTTSSSILNWTIGNGPRVLITTDGAIWRAAAGLVTELVGPNSDPLPALGHDRYATVDRLSGVITIHDVASGAAARIGRVQGPLSVHISRDGRTVVVRARDTILRWDDPTPAAAVWPAWKAIATPASLAAPDAALQWRAPTSAAGSAR